MSCRQHGYPWPSLATSPYHSSLLAGLQGSIPYPHIAAVCMFELVVLLMLGHMRGSISSGGNTQQGTNYTATCLPSRKLYKLDEPDTQDTSGEARTNSSVMYPIYIYIYIIIAMIINIGINIGFTFPTLSCLVFYSFRAHWLYSLII